MSVMLLSLMASKERIFVPESFELRYTLMSTCMLAFAFGSLLYHIKNALALVASPFWSMAAWLAHCGIWLLFPSYPWEAGLYGSMVLSGWVTLSLFPIRSGRFDVILGELAYPVYLLHSVAGMWVLMLWSGFCEVKSLWFFALSFGLTLAVSALVVFFFDRKIMRLKRLPKSRSL